MKSNATVPGVDAKLADVIDRLAGALDRVASGVPDLDKDERVRLVETLSPIADQLDAAGLDDQPVVGDQADALPRLYRPVLV